MTRSEFELIKTLIDALMQKVSEMTDDIKDVSTKVDELGKVIQTPEGNGTMEDPYKGWQVGQSVEAGKWYSTSDGYLWEAIKTGVPTSSTDREYFDVVGL